MSAGGPAAADSSADGTDAARARLADQLRLSGRAGSRLIEEAFRAVPRHMFLPEMAPAAAYRDEALIVKQRADGVPVSSSSQPAMMAIMLEQLALEPGQRVLEIGTGTGYNAALLSRIVGDKGSVVTVDIDPELAARARASLAAAGFSSVLVTCGDGGFGVPEQAPYDRVIVTAGAWALAPAWLAQLAAGGRIVVPMSVRGIQLSVALRQAAGHWASTSAYRCGFIRMAGAFAGPEQFVPLGPQPGWQVQAGDGLPVDAAGLYQALTGPVTDAPTGLRVTGPQHLSDLDLWLTLSEPRLTRLTLMDAAPAAGRPGPVPLLALGGLAEPDQGGPASRPASAPGVASLWPAGGSGVMVRGFGTRGAALAGYLAARAPAWDELGRPGAADIRLSVFPPDAEPVALAGQQVAAAGQPVGAAGQVVMERGEIRLVAAWSAR